ncbi:hypothetical protein TNIN_136641 [Trichonephila inaurata madagascariensis]|uniref:Secreted protein n=1 Tax=Trichonephila inaurata madagascariensis TaxID=2747483 RepID=A0A8X6K099_9ARAC|nr:hypothetical protein TNIN_136641 [Trichonephila inaurata madagascariensis]
MRSLVMTVFAWSGLWSSPTLTACTKTGTPFSNRLVRDTFLPVNGHHPPMNSCRFLTFHCQKSDLTLRCSSIVEFCNANAILSSYGLPHHLDAAFYKSHCSLLRMRATAHDPIPVKASNGIPRCLSTFSPGRICKYLTVSFLCRFVPFSFDHPL